MPGPSAGTGTATGRNGRGATLPRVSGDARRRCRIVSGIPECTICHERRRRGKGGGRQEAGGAVRTCRRTAGQGTALSGLFRNAAGFARTVSLHEFFSNGLPILTRLPGSPTVKTKRPSVVLPHDGGPDHINLRGGCHGCSAVYRVCTCNSSPSFRAILHLGPDATSVIAGRFRFRDCSC